MKKISTRAAVFLLAVTVALSNFAAAAGGIVKSDTETNYLKYITGFADGTVRPDAPVTRAQAAKMLSYVIDAEAGEAVFSDVSQSFWGYSAIARLCGAGLLKGYADGTFRPDAGMTRAAFATVLARALGIEETQNAGEAYTDVQNHWARGAITALAAAGYVSGYQDGSFRPDGVVSRAEAVAMINRACGIEPREQQSVSFSDLSSTHWAYGAIMAAASPYALEDTEPRGNIKFEDMTYIDVDAAQVKAQVNALLSEFQTATAKRQAEIYDEISKLAVQIGTAVTMTEINISRDVSNAKYQTDYQNVPALRSYYREMLLARYQAVQNTKYPEELSEILGFDIRTMETPAPSIPDELTALYEKEAQLVAQFDAYYYGNAISVDGKNYSLAQALSEGGTPERLAEEYALKTYKIPGEIFDQLVDVRTQIANFFGYDNYAEIGYLISGKSTYGPEQTEILRNEVKETLVPLVREIVAAASNPDSDYQYPNFTWRNTKKITLDEAMAEVHAMSPQTRQVLEYLRKYHLLDLLARENKDAGAFSIHISEWDSPFLFMNYDESRLGWMTFAHEFGHCVQYFRLFPKQQKQGIASDLAEIASYGMEMLVANSYPEHYGELAQEAERELLYYDMQIMLSTCVLDEFQVEVYRHPEMTIEQRNALYGKICQEYFGAFSENTDEVRKKGILWDSPGHIFETPFYAIDYTLALNVALQIWEKSKVDFDAAFEMYLNVIESEYSDYGIDTVCRVAGLRSPFAEDGMSTTIALLKKQFLKETPTALAS